MDLKYRLQNFSEIYLFEWPKNLGVIEDLYSGPRVNEFISFLKYYKVLAPFRFNAISSDSNLIHALSLKENILMDFSSDSLTSSKDYQFEEILAKHKNPHLKELLTHMNEADLKPNEASAEAIKSAQIIKALISDSQYLFMETPEKDLSYQQFCHFLDAVKFHCQHHQVNIFISSPHPEMWARECQFYIQRNSQFGFEITSVAKTSFFEDVSKNSEVTLEFKYPKTSKKTKSNSSDEAA